MGGPGVVVVAMVVGMSHGGSWIQKWSFNILKFTEINVGLENNVTINSLMLLLFLE